MIDKYYIKEEKAKELLEINDVKIEALEENFNKKTEELEELTNEVNSLERDLEQRRQTIYDCKKVLKIFKIINENKLFIKDEKIVKTKNVFTRNKEIFIEYDLEGVLCEILMEKYLRFDNGFSEYKESEKKND